MAKDEAAKMLIKVEGDTHLAIELGKVLQHIRWDVEEDLSKAVGDIAANKLVSASKIAVSTARKQASNVVGMLSEYWQEEKPVLAKKWQVEKFNTEVDTLRSDFTRLEKRLAKLTKHTQESSTN
jgi:ubiquinone biosynthesis protein UbiJ